jgi:hypothetical protein
MNLKNFWTPIMVILGIAIIVMLLVIFRDTGTFPQVDWSAINPKIIQFVPWIAFIGIAFAVFLYLRR